MKYSSWEDLAPREAGTQPGPPGHCGQVLVSSSLVSKLVFFSKTYHRPKRASCLGIYLIFIAWTPGFFSFGGFVVCFCFEGLVFWFGGLGFFFE